MISVDSDCDSISGHSDTEPQLHMIMFKEVVSGVGSSKTLMFMGIIQGHSVVILIDSGSSHSFVNSRLTQVLVGLSTTAKHVHV
jgi:hypothetical protein